jgi:uncharacterized protein YgbK (DUF1537 family)
MHLLIIADDLTGSADTGVQFAKRGFHTILLPFGLKGESELREAQVVALNTNTRGMQAKSAYETVKDATAAFVQAFHPQNIYKKIDSTMRGNVGAEIEAVLNASDSAIAIVAPAFPDYNRATIDGIHFVNGQPLSQTEAILDPVSPVTESHIPTLLQVQTKLKPGHIDLKEVRRGASSLKHLICQRVRDGEKIIVFDAVTDDDLSKIAEVGMSISPRPLMVGSAGLANQLSMMFERPVPPESHIAVRDREGIIVIVSGSLSNVTSSQLDEVRRSGKGKIIPVQVHKLLEDQELGRENTFPSLVAGGIWQVVSEVLSAMEFSKAVGVQSVKGICLDTQNVESRHAVTLRVADCLGMIALQIVKECPQPVRALILTGGDTALSVFRHLGISQVRLIDEVLPGIPYSQVVDGEFDGLNIVTKAGAFGNEKALVGCIDFLM